MQDFVTLKKKNNKRQSLIFSAFMLILIIFIIVIIFISNYIKNKSNKVFLEDSFFLVYVEKSKNVKELENLQDNLKELGGAGKIYQKDNFYYLISNVYKSQDSAKTVVENHKAVYKNANILEIKTKKLEKKTIRKYKENEINLKFVKHLNYTIEAILNYQIQFLSGEITENDLCSSLLTIKFDLDDLLSEIKLSEDNVYKELVLNYSNIEQMYFSSFFNNFFDSDKKTSILCEFVVGIIILKIDFFNNL